jgi:cell shape-determining protein MreD
LKRVAGLFTAGLIGLVLQGVASALLPAAWIPDVAMLFAVGVAVAAGGAQSLGLAAGVGYTADLLSRSLFGEHAALAALAWVATRGVSLQIDLARIPTRMAFVALLSAVSDLGHVGLERLFSGSAGLDAAFARGLGIHAFVNAIVCLFFVGAIRALSARLDGEEDAPRRALRVGPRGPVSRRGLVR